MKHFVSKWLAASTFFTLLTCLGASIGSAQATNTGTVVGVVADQSGAVIPDANVTLTDVSTNASRSTTSSHTGQYVFVNVSPGVYNITASKAGFELDKLINQTVLVGTQATANFTLHVGNTQQTVEVQAAGTDLQTLNATVGSTVEEEALAELPSLLHDAGTFTTLQAGISPDGSVAGSVVDQSSFLLDGGDNTNDMDGSMSVYTGSFAGDPTGGIASGNQGLATSPTGVIPTPADSVEEFKVNATGQTADFNSSAGAQVEVVTKRGTNKWHGTAYEYYLDNNFSANSWQHNNPANYAKPPDYHYSKFGFGAGGTVLPRLLGGKTYFFALYQGWRYPNSEVITWPVPSPTMEKGLLTFDKGATYLDMKALDPRHIGINPTVLGMWTKYMPQGTAAACGSVSNTCDEFNTFAIQGNLSLPYKDDFLVGRLDHDFGDKNHLMASYRYYKLTKASDTQVDIGGFFKGDKLGTPASTASRPQQPWFFVVGFTSSITSRLTNDFHYSYLRNYWSWSDNNAPAQVAGLGGALEPFGETSRPLAPFNVNTQSVRTRFWDGQDHMLRDDVTTLKGNHLFQFGGTYQHNFNSHQRTDNGGGINDTLTYQLGDSVGGGLVTGYPATPAGFTGSGWRRYFAAMTGIVTDSQQAFTRTGATLALNPPFTPASDKSTIPYYNVYFSDTWHMKPTFTLTYGLGWTVEMPPTEATGKQIEFVDNAGQPIDLLSYINQRQQAALQGQVFNPIVGYALLGNTANSPKYPYNPYYGSFSPRLAAAWNPQFGDNMMGTVFGHNNTVIRAGFGRIYGRLNGVDLVLVPLLGTGLIQPVLCQKAFSTGACGPGTPTATTAFRIGVDGATAPLAAATPTLPQPLFPGVNNVAASAGEALDPHFRPNVVNSFDLTIQRQLTSKMTVEIGYIGRLINNEYQPVNVNAVPYMMTLGGQTFAKAYAAVETAMGCATSAAICNNLAGPPAVAAQPFFEAALAGTGYCTGFANCTAAVVSNEFSNFQTQSVWSLWSDLDQGGIGGANAGGTNPGFNFARTMLNTQLPSAFPNGANGQIASGVGINASIGHGNYHGGFVSWKINDWHGVTSQTNFTYSKALGTGAFVQATSEYTPNDPYNLDNTYGVQAFNRKYVFNQYLVIQPHYYESQQGIVGRLLGGWTFAPILTAGSGAPLYCNTQTDAQAFGSGDGNNFFDNEQCVTSSTFGDSAIRGVAGSNGVGTATAGATAATQINIFSDPNAAFNTFRAPILGIDTKNPGVGPIVGLPYWNMDLQVKKRFKVWESANIELSTIFLNVLNHNQFADPTLDISNPAGFGVINHQANGPRQIEFGVRVNW